MMPTRKRHKKEGRVRVTEMAVQEKIKKNTRRRQYITLCNIAYV